MGIVYLLITTIIWGAAFLAQKLGMDHVGPFAFTFYRNLLAALFIFLLHPRLPNMVTLIGGMRSGVALWAAMMLQQLGIMDTSPGVCAFLTTNYVLAVPLLGLLLRRRSHRWVWPAAIVAAIGTFLICVSNADTAKVGLGEWLSLACALVFGVQIMIVDHEITKPKVDLLSFCTVQFAMGTLLGVPFLALASERTFMTWEHLKAGTGAIAFCGLLSSGVAYTLQNVGQKTVKPAVAAIIMSLESVFATIFAWLFLDDILTLRQLVGCALIFISVIGVQLGETLRRHVREV